MITSGFEPSQNSGLVNGNSAVISKDDNVLVLWNDGPFFVRSIFYDGNFLRQFSFLCSHTTVWSVFKYVFYTLAVGFYKIGLWLPGDLKRLWYRDQIISHILAVMVSTQFKILGV